MKKLLVGIRVLFYFSYSCFPPDAKITALSIICPCVKAEDFLDSALMYPTIQFGIPKIGIRKSEVCFPILIVKKNNRLTKSRFAVIWFAVI